MIKRSDRPYFNPNFLQYSPIFSECPTKMFKFFASVRKHFKNHHEKETPLICKKCNSKKTNLMLRVFCKKQNYDYDDVCDRLERLGKDV